LARSYKFHAIKSLKTVASVTTVLRTQIPRSSKSLHRNKLLLTQNVEFVAVDVVKVTN